MRRSMHSLIVALLCLTLFVDSAKACWWLRQHRSRAQVCRPAACDSRPAVPCTVVLVEQQSDDAVFVDDHSDCLCGSETVEHAAVEHAVDEHAAVNAVAPATDSVVVHGPTMVVDAAPVQAAPSMPEPTSVVAQPMPIAATGSPVLPTPAPAEEPIPTLKPAIAPLSPVAPASNEQPMIETPAKPTAEATEAAEKTAKNASDSETDDTDDMDEAAAPMPVPVEDLAGGPTQKPMMPEPKEPNLFDLYGDEDTVSPDEEAPSEEAPTDAPAENAGDDADQPADTDDATTDEAPADEAEMTDDAAESTEPEDSAAESTDGDDETAEEAAPAAEPTEGATAEEADAAPESEPEQAKADPAAAALAVPNEPMRRWTDATGAHHTQGWLVSLRNDRVRILKVNGRHATVSTESLSAEDRDYVSAVGARLAAERQGTSPAPSTTAGL